MHKNKSDRKVCNQNFYYGFKCYQNRTTWIWCSHKYYFFATFIDISDFAILYLQPNLCGLWVPVGKSQIPVMGDLVKTTAVGIWLGPCYWLPTKVNKPIFLLRDTSLDMDWGIRPGLESKQSRDMCVFEFELVLVFPWENYRLLLISSYPLLLWGTYILKWKVV